MTPDSALWRCMTFGAHYDSPHYRELPDSHRDIVNNWIDSHPGIDVDRCRSYHILRSQTGSVDRVWFELLDPHNGVSWAVRHLKPWPRVAFDVLDGDMNPPDGGRGDAEKRLIHDMLVFAGVEPTEANINDPSLCIAAADHIAEQRHQQLMEAVERISKRSRKPTMSTGPR